MLSYVNDRFVPESEAVVSAQDRGFRFGDGVFETIGVYNSVPYQWDFHMQRLQAGLAALAIAFDTASLRVPCEALIRRNEMPECLLRIAVSRGAGSRGYLPLPNITPTLVIETVKKMPLRDMPFALWLSTFEKISPKALPVQCKLASGLNSMLARQEAEANGCVDGLQLNAQGQICETSSANIFWLKDGVLHTPALACGVLNGSTRHALMRHSPWPVAEGAYALDALQGAQAVVICSAGMQVLAINALKPLGRQWDSVALAQQLRAVLQEDIRRQRGNAQVAN